MKSMTTDMNEREREIWRNGYEPIYTFIDCITDMLVALLFVGIQLSVQIDIEYRYLGK